MGSDPFMQNYSKIIIMLHIVQRWEEINLDLTPGFALIITLYFSP